MDIITDISGLDLGSCFLDIMNSNLVYCSTAQPRPNTLSNRDSGIDADIMYDVDQDVPPAKIELIAADLSYALVQSTIANDPAMDEKEYPDDELPTEPTLKEYIEKLRLNNKYLVITL